MTLEELQRWRRFTASRNGRPTVRYARRDVELWLSKQVGGGGGEGGAA